MSNVQFKLLSLNARGIRAFEKRNALFDWLMKDQAQVCFIQESYGTSEIENSWRKEWKGDLFLLMAQIIGEEF
jgi:exonuclease III